MKRLGLWQIGDATPTQIKKGGVDLTEPDIPDVFVTRRTPTVEEVCGQADHNGVGEPFRELLKAATETGLFPRPYGRSIMYTPPSNRNRILFTVWVKGVQGRLRAYVSPKASLRRDCLIAYLTRRKEEK